MYIVDPELSPRILQYPKEIRTLYNVIFADLSIYLVPKNKKIKSVVASYVTILWVYIEKYMKFANSKAVTLSPRMYK